MELTTRRPMNDLLQHASPQQVATQVALEERMVNTGKAQVQKQLEKAREKGNESQTNYGQSLIARTVDGISAEVSAFVEKAKTGGAGRRHAAVKYLVQVDADVAAFTAIRVIVDSLTGKKQLVQRAAIQIASKIEDEVRFTAFKEADKSGFNRAQERAKKGTVYHRRKATMAGYERRYMETKWESWPEQDKLHLGMCLINMMVDAELIQIGTEITTRKATNKVIEPTAKIVERIERDNLRNELMNPAHLPMCVEPLPWTTPFDGGYFTEEAQGRNDLVKSRNPNYLSELADRADEMPAVYTAVNALQSTRWKINPDVFAVMSKMWEIDSRVGELLPSREDISHVPCPVCGEPVELPKLNTRDKVQHDCFDDEETGEETLTKWKRKAHEVHAENVSLRSKRMAMWKTLKVAETMSDCEEVFFPYQLDFRGRVYAIPSFNPQGADPTKGLLTFAEGKPLEDGVAAGWLAIHGANVFGFDKASMEDRIAWVEDHNEMIKAVAKDPMAETWWTSADKAWQFLAFCFEWAGFLEHGYGYVSHLPVALDGTCSGIQHFSAMLRDREGGEAVNLLPQDTPADIYQRVCDLVVEKLKRDAGEISSPIAQVSPAKVKCPNPSSPQEEDEAKGKNTKGKNTKAESTSSDEDEVQFFARAWLKLDPNRKTTKRQVMTLPYGATQFSCRSYTEKWLKDQLKEGYALPWDKTKTFKATCYLSGLIWESISEVVVAARQAMDWLQVCAKVVAREELPVYWQTPCGFPVMQKYNDVSARRVKTKLGDSVLKLSLQQSEPTIDKRRMANAISPNFVHSMDATHLVMSVDTAVDNGIGDFAMIHDSFGTHAANSNLLAACLREAFVDLYEDKDVLEDFRQQITAQVSPEDVEEIPAVPSKGDLDVTEVRDSDFFFA